MAFIRGYTSSADIFSLSSLLRINGPLLRRPRAPRTWFHARYLTSPHTALHAAEDFRLLRILPRKSNDSPDHIECEFVPASLRYAVPPYLAISYAWGDPTIKHEIHIGSQKLGVSQSAFDVLQRFRSGDETGIRHDHFRYIWIDAVCIDQSNIIERNQQVKLMGQIYSKAFSVIVWLGREADDSSLLAPFIVKVANAFRRGGLAQQRNLGDFSDFEKWFFQVTETTYDSREWNALAKLFQRPWFKRLWVVQETVRSSQFDFRVGNDWFRLSDLYKVAHLTLSFGFTEGRLLKNLEKLAGHGMSNLISMASSNNNFREAHQEGFATLYQRFSWSESQEPKDRVFALMGLDPVLNAHMEPEYRDNLQTVYTKTVQTLLSNNQPEILSLAGIGLDRDHSSTTGLPSWVPDFSKPIENKATFGVFPVLARADYKSGPRGGALFEIEGKFLNLLAIKYDSIAGLGPALTTPPEIKHNQAGLNRRYYESIWRWLDAADFLYRRSRYAHEGPRGEAQWRSLIADRIWTSMTPSTLETEGTGPASKESGETFRLMTALNGPADCIASSLNSHIEHVLHVQDAFWNSQEYFPLPQRPTMNLKLGIRKFARAFEDAAFGRRYCVTSNGDVALVPKYAHRGDIICVFAGVRVPFVIRPRYIGAEQVYSLVGECYVHGIMRTEGKGLGELEKITLI